MKKHLLIAAQLLLVAFVLNAPLRAQDAPATDAPKTPASKTSAPKTPAAKTTPGTATSKSRTGAAATAKTSAPITLNTQKDKVSYAIGLNIGRSLHKDAVDVDTTIFMRGLKDALTGSKFLLTDEQMKAVMTELQAQLRKKQEDVMAQASTANKQAGDAFLAANKAKEGVVTLPSGLQYKVLKEGTGPKPTATDTVMCNYRGTLIDSTEFDSSYKRGQPAAIPVSGVIKGWTEALQLMPVGSKWELVIPPDLAYGNQGAGQEIGPNSTLIFEVELLSIQDKAQEKKPAS